MAAYEANPNATRAEFLQTEQSFHPSQHLLISCGTVPVDSQARKIAILRDSADSTVSLPKGRKNIGEDLLSAAMRETRKETGLAAEALPLLVATRATPATELAGTFSIGQNPDVTDGLLNCEPSSVCVYPCIFTGALKMVFWFASRVEERQAPDEVEQVPWDANVRLDWVDAREAAGLMSFKADGQVVKKVLEDMRHSGL